MDAPGGQEKHVSGVHVIAGQNVRYGAFGHLGGILLRGNLFRETGQQVGARLRIYHIPHFGFSLGAIVPDGGQLVVRVHLDAEVGEGVDELNQERELVAGTLINMLSHQLFLVLFHQGSDGAALQGPFGHHAFIAGYSGKLPAFSNMLLLCLNTFVRGDFLTAPYKGFENRFEF